MNCIFCSIAKKKASAEIVYEDDQLVAFKDINPKAPVHILIIPKEHIASVNDLTEINEPLLGQMIIRAKALAVKSKIARSGYKLVLNCGRDAGQLVDHLHLHLLGGGPLDGIA
ncbi:MAG: histidine triad nucleotide-binding protein [Candidatus Kerfeldbacteria bacterium CG_4_10_14_0_8_um_filter_42_10]|uniref:Histidine triad nucleotide-binding protein n=1 Tax=Candidatus Kerfeldbacteria bacterium CG_4_10_14_0_8_um_filter_42_10 TaxID=2014248 RepID=A0A2M7RKF6_9BACT|nr:MAG: histidine triad nucleotide-binding protein [Candidatus Kerfeldbacteria bacterium CG_4_10_14_0_8_um_filter_42_10]